MSFFVFWAAVFVVAYTYVGYPLLLAARARVLRRPYRSADTTPRLSLIVCAYNEAASIRAKLENALSRSSPGPSGLSGRGPGLLGRQQSVCAGRPARSGPPVRRRNRWRRSRGPALSGKLRARGCGR